MAQTDQQQLQQPPQPPQPQLQQQQRSQLLRYRRCIATNAILRRLIAQIQ